MSMCRCAPCSRARRSSGRRRAAASSRPRSGASGRSSGVSADTFTDRLTRGSGPSESRSSSGRSGQPRADSALRVERLGAALGVAVGLGLGHRRLAEQVERGRHALVPQRSAAPARPSRGDSPTMKRCAMWRTPAAAAAPSARPARARVRHPHRRRERRRLLARLAEVLRQVRGQVVERAAGGRHVDQPEQRGAQLVVGRGQLHRPFVERPQRVARARGEGRVDRPSDLQQVTLHGS